MAEKRTSGRFNLLEKPTAYPFADIVNNTPEGPVFDLGVDLEMRDGVVYIKAEHVQEMAEQLGMLSEEEATELRAEVAQLKLEATMLPEKIDRFQNGLDALVRDYHDANLSGSDSSGSPIVEESTGPESPKSSGSGEGAFKADGQSFGFDFLKGPDDVPASPSNAAAGKSNTKG